MGASILFVGQDLDIGTPSFREIYFLKIVLTSYRIERIFGKILVAEPWRPVPGGGSGIPCWRFLRSCQNPIGRAQPKK